MHRLVEKVLEILEVVHGSGQTVTQSSSRCGKYHDFHGGPELEASNVVITGNVLVCYCQPSVLFVSGSTFYYVSAYFPLIWMPHVNLFSCLFVFLPLYVIL